MDKLSFYSCGLKAAEKLLGARQMAMLSLHIFHLKPKKGDGSKSHTNSPNSLSCPRGVTGDVVERGHRRLKIGCEGRFLRSTWFIPFNGTEQVICIYGYLQLAFTCWHYFTKQSDLLRGIEPIVASSDLIGAWPARVKPA